MIIRIKEFEKKIEEIKQEKNLSNKEIANIMKMDYTYIFRLFKENANPGKKVINGIENFCKEFGLDSKDYIFLE